MKRIKHFAVVAMISIVATAGYAGYTAYEYANMTDAERMLMANLEALTKDEKDGSFWLDTFGCDGGDYKCFTGSLSFAGVSVSGTWYKRD